EKKEAEEKREKLKQQLTAMQANGDEVTLLAAIYAPGQFGVVSNGSIGRYLSNPKASCRQAAQEAINGYTTVGSFTHFKNAASPVSGDHIVIGNHVFY
ncbi:MAG: cell wall hydrolase, partial [Lachnospiraceae bacterium]|nr:cell wall hydrolase [Lachnospiraceae bacterium]